MGGFIKLLTAYLPNETKISMLDQWKLKELQALRGRVDFTCPICRKTVILKLGSKKIWHFAHKKEENCKLHLESESNYHLQGKIDIYHWLKNQGYQAALEVYLPIINQRPDILLKKDSKLFAIEFQCSSVPLANIQKRNRGYKQIGITPIWILGANRLRRKTSDTYHVESIEWEMMIESGIKLQLIYYCPEAKKWALLQNIISYSSKKALANLKVYPYKEVTYSLLFQSPISQVPLKNWLTIRKQWRKHLPLNQRNLLMKNYYHLLYQRKVPLSLFPLEAGWPTPYHYQLECSPLIWQTFFLLNCLEYQPLFKSISFTFFYQWLLTFIHSNRLLIRFEEKPLIKKMLIFYLDWLCEVGLLSKESDFGKIYTKLKPITIPSSLEEAIQYDAKCLPLFINTFRRIN
ncbi:competence protein CoiA [Alkalihalobacillus trypoxylicola]|uniref:Competence protein CoiA n=1 Tax=Alkalihalobacillus trypoxylicola TaxID=519424 RepID=A0A162EF02_9BACI|nr:competence protein CoiA family protein [Alkalihalobacillus trypoxylicola]KYG32415.1 hypothetical protein AZF04_06545 [Alkalihalobacillus trypoxylicola]